MTSLFLTCHVNHHIAATKSSSILASVPTNLCITLNISSLVTPLVSASKWVHFQIEKSFYLSIHRFANSSLFWWYFHNHKDLNLTVIITYFVMAVVLRRQATRRIKGTNICTIRYSFSIFHISTFINSNKGKFCFIP